MNTSIINVTVSESLGYGGFFFNVDQKVMKRVYLLVYSYSFYIIHGGSKKEKNVLGNPKERKQWGVIHIPEDDFLVWSKKNQECIQSISYGAIGWLRLMNSFLLHWPQHNASLVSVLMPI